MLKDADTSPEWAKEAFAEFGAEAGYFSPTENILKKDIFDVPAELREYLRERSIHDFDLTEPERLDTTITLVHAHSTNTTEIAFYRTNRRDRRARITGLPKYANAGNLLAIVAIGGALFLVNCSNHDLMESRHVAGSPLRELLNAAGNTLPEAKPGDALTVDEVAQAIAYAQSQTPEEVLSELGSPGTSRYVLVDADFEFDAKALIQLAWNRAHPDSPIAWSDFGSNEESVARPLRELGYWVEDLENDGSTPDPEAEGPAGRSKSAYLAAAERLPTELDGKAISRTRREQNLLRGALGLFESDESACALCGRTLPCTLLVAAHIKPRSQCSPSEQRDIEHIAMAACTLGCDSLFEAGWISVANGYIVVSSSLEHFADLIPVAEALRDRPVAAWNEHSAEYFNWHRENRFVE